MHYTACYITPINTMRGVTVCHCDSHCLQSASPYLFFSECWTPVSTAIFLKPNAQVTFLIGLYFLWDEEVLKKLSTREIQANNIWKPKQWQAIRTLCASKDMCRGTCPLVVTAATDHWHNWDSRNGAVLPGQCSACAGGHTEKEGSALHDAAAINGRNVLG